ncbi:MAG TPA: LCP family protein [Acidimicrobiia bacterium]|nr:LCP family protein [Acidimicrobiia bacterium]
MRWLVVALVLSACSPAVTETVTPPSPPATTTSTPALSTSTVPPARPTRLRGGGTAWRQAVANVYGPACDGDRSLVPPEMTDWAMAEDCPADGQASSAMIAGTTVAVAVLGNDVLYGFDQGSGFQIVAARVPSLEGAYYGALPKTVAVIGSDARPGEEAASSRADSIHIFTLDGQGRGAIVGVPRDSWVDYAGGGRGKINGSLSLGGPDLFLQTLANVTGLNYDGYLLTGFEGFQELWGNVLGGANLELDSGLVDRSSGANFSAGFQYFNGPQALSFARARKNLAGGDLQRSLNGGMLLQGALSTAQHLGPLALPSLMQRGWPWLVTDLTAGEILGLAALATDTPLTALANAVAPGRIGTAGAASVVYLTSGAGEMFGDLLDGSLGA